MKSHEPTKNDNKADIKSSDTSSKQPKNDVKTTKEKITWEEFCSFEQSSRRPSKGTE